MRLIKAIKQLFGRTQKPTWKPDKSLLERISKVGIDATHLKQMPKVCSHCPYRKDKPNWLSTASTYWNVAFVRQGKQQICHTAHEKGHTLGCAGARICLQGGNSQVVSLQELADREPAAGHMAECAAYFECSVDEVPAKQLLLQDKLRYLRGRTTVL